MEPPRRRRHTDDEPLPLPSAVSLFFVSSDLAFPQASCAPASSSGSAGSSLVASGGGSEALTGPSKPLPLERRTPLASRPSPRSSASSTGPRGAHAPPPLRAAAVCAEASGKRSSRRLSSSSAQREAARADENERPLASTRPRRRRSSGTASDAGRGKRSREHEETGGQSGAQLPSLASRIPATLGADEGAPFSPASQPSSAALASASAQPALAPAASLPVRPLSRRSQGGSPPSDPSSPRASSEEEAKDLAATPEGSGPNIPLASSRSPSASAASSPRGTSSPLSRRLSLSPRYSNFSAASPLLRRGRRGVKVSLAADSASDLDLPASFLLAPASTEEKKRCEPVSLAALERRDPAPGGRRVDWISPPSSSPPSAPAVGASASSSSSKSSLRVDRCATCGCAVFVSPAPSAADAEESSQGLLPRAPTARRAPEASDGAGHAGDQYLSEDFDQETARLVTQPRPGAWGETQESDTAGNESRTALASRRRLKSAQEAKQNDRRPQCTACRSRVYIQAFFDDLRSLASGFHSSLRSLTRAVALSPQAASLRAGGEGRRKRRLSVERGSGLSAKNALSAGSASSHAGPALSSTGACSCGVCASFLVASAEREAFRDEGRSQARSEAGRREGVSESFADEACEEGGAAAGGACEGSEGTQRPNPPPQAQSLACLLRAARRHCGALEDRLGRLPGGAAATHAGLREEAHNRGVSGEEKRDLSVNDQVSAQSLRRVLEALHQVNELKLERLVQSIAGKGGNLALALGDRLEDLSTPLPGFHTSVALLLGSSARAPVASLAPKNAARGGHAEEARCVSVPGGADAWNASSAPSFPSGSAKSASSADCRFGPGGIGGTDAVLSLRAGSLPTPAASGARRRKRPGEPSSLAGWLSSPRNLGSTFLSASLGSVASSAPLQGLNAAGGELAAAGEPAADVSPSSLAFLQPRPASLLGSSPLASGAPRAFSTCLDGARGLPPCGGAEAPAGPRGDAGDALVSAPAPPSDGQERRKKRASATSQSPGTRLKSLGLSAETLRMLGPLSKQKTNAGAPGCE
ncbi:hypothetical protein BESB_020270 [Besnoitia besnoiti]|uniref:Uncharacterized protein n=1 Tax=Besnoitia besnoiti TaxID=94643 RepID=A0A2A9M836_BESBE|nr:hypothetical protein BESB_020270 [Besnoitia besnoiti]PFH32086.1 hypothetical protein BESB_020270 [Besnoitia besnoiti]